MILDGGDAASTGRTRRWVLFTLILSILALVGGLVLVLLLSQFYIVPHLQSDDFVQTQCYVRSIEIKHIKKEGKVINFNNPNCTKGAAATSKSPPKPNYDNFDFTLSGTTLHPPGFYPTKPSSIFTRNYGSSGNRRTFPDQTARKARPSNIYRSNNWDPFDTGFQAQVQPKSQPQVQPKHVPAPQAQAQAQSLAHHLGLPQALVQAQVRPQPYSGRYRRSMSVREELEGAADLLPQALAQFAQEPPVYQNHTQSIEQTQYHGHGLRHVRKAVARSPGVHSLVPAPNPHPSPDPRVRFQHTASKDCSTGFVQAGTLCVHVSVLFRGLDGFVALGTLYADQKSLPRGNTTTALGWPTKKCICDGCTITALSGNGSSVDEILVGKTKIRQGTRTRCYYPMTGGGHLLMFRTSNAIALHAILWPTLVFVSGFVGLFFSCLIIQKQRQQQRKQQTRPPMAYV